MSPKSFRLPDIGEGVAEAEIVAWHVKVGDVIREDQSLVDVMTDKATVDMTSPFSGRVAALHGAVGERVPVGSVLVEFGEESVAQAGAAQTAPEAPEPIAPGPPLTEPATTTPTVDSPLIAAPRMANAAETTAPASRAPSWPATSPEARPRRGPNGAERPLASPAVRKRAYERGIPLQFVSGSGPGGRILDADLESYEPGATRPTAGLARRDGITETKLVGLRRVIAERMQTAKRTIPHFGYVEEFDLTELEALRRECNAESGKSRPKLTLLPFFLRAVARLVPDFPNVNATYNGEAGVLRTHEAVHVGIATQTKAGLMVPVVRHAEAMTVWDAARELARVTAAARDGTATRDELSGSTITLTSLGALGGISATPVINAPEVAIIGPNKLVDRPMVRDGQVVVRTMMNVSTSFDHRIVDGYDAARFVQALKRLIERPALLFMDAP